MCFIKFHTAVKTKSGHVKAAVLCKALFGNIKMFLRALVFGHNDNISLQMAGPFKSSTEINGNSSDSQQSGTRSQKEHQQSSIAKRQNM